MRRSWVIAALAVMALSAVAAAARDDPAKKKAPEPKIEAVAEERDPYRDRGVWRPNAGLVTPHALEPRRLSQDEIHAKFHKPTGDWSWANEAVPEPKRLRRARGDSAMTGMANVIAAPKDEPERERPSRAVPANIVHREREPEPVRRLVQADTSREPEPDPVPRRLVQADTSREADGQTRRRRHIVSADVVHADKPLKRRHRKRPTVMADAHVTLDEPSPKLNRRRRSRVVADAHITADEEPKRQRRRRRPDNRVPAIAHAEWDAPRELASERAERKAAARAAREADRVTVTPFTYINNDAPAPRRRHRRTPAPELITAERKFSAAEDDEEEGDRPHRHHKEPELVSADIRFNANRF